MVEEYLAARRALVERYLGAYLERRAEGLPETLYEVLPTAVELFHTYSLIHDDLPALDDADLRREQLTAHRVFGEGAALLAGDALIPLGFELIAAEQVKLSPPESVLRAIELVSAALGPEGMVGGQLLDLGEDEGPTYAQLVGARGARAEAERLTAEALEALAPLGAGAAKLRALGRWLLARSS